jgi:hypothetical protein
VLEVGEQECQLVDGALDRGQVWEGVVRVLARPDQDYSRTPWIGERHPCSSGRGARDYRAPTVRSADSRAMSARDATCSFLRM